MLDKGIFTVSIDFEFAWGYADHDLSPEQKEKIKGESFIVSRLLGLFEKYDIPATWAIVGHLIDRGCSWGKGLPHPEYPRPIHKGETRDWFRDHPSKDDYSSELWFDANNLISKIRHGKVDHEVASHSYAHILYDENVTDEESIKADLKNLGRVHRVHDVPLSTFIFPRNVNGFYRLLKINGFTTYRGNSPKWYDKYTGIKKRFAHFIDHYNPKGKTVLPEKHDFGLLNIPDSMLLMGRNGLRKLILPGAVKRKAKNGLVRAEKQKEIFHLWFHPSNFSYDTETQFEIFEDILKKAAKMRSEGKIDIETMQTTSIRILKYEGNHS